jgi:hypothetical protein
LLSVSIRMSCDRTLYSVPKNSSRLQCGHLGRRGPGISRIVRKQLGQQDHTRPLHSGQLARRYFESPSKSTASSKMKPHSYRKQIPYPAVSCLHCGEASFKKGWMKLGYSTQLRLFAVLRNLVISGNPEAKSSCDSWRSAMAYWAH